MLHRACFQDPFDHFAARLASAALFVCLAGPALAQQSGFPPEVDQLGIQLGDPDAEVVVREFADYQCPACKAFEPTVKRLIEEYVDTGQVRFVFFDFPLNMHEHALPAAEAARCAGRQDAYWPMHDSLFEKQSQWSKADDPVERFAEYADRIGIDGGKLAECVRNDHTRRIVEQNRELAGQLQIRSTPTLIVNDTGIKGMANWSRVKSVIESELAGESSGAQSEQAAVSPQPLDPDREMKTVDSNRMSQATSPYLQLHADNPVDWYPWGEAAFEKARKENKPVFVSIGYFTCYWCHVMERESFSNPEVADLLNRFFVPIKIDREQRPGVDSLYMRAVNVMGERGGWPLSIFLTPERKPFFGGTYYPRRQFINVLQHIDATWQQQPDRVLGVADRVTEALGQIERSAGVSEPGSIPPAEMLQRAEAALAGVFDDEWGGFGGAPKFPQPSNLVFLLDRHQRSGSEQALEMVTATLDAMAAGGIRDHLGGGFHRYSTDARWHVPHFEKMLYDNAQLLEVYARAWRITEKPLYREVAEGIVRYLDSTLTDPDTGLLYSAQSALVDEEEGESYIWTPQQVEAALDDEQRIEVAKRVYGIDGEADLEGAHVLHRSQSYQQIASGLDGLDAGDLEAMHATIDAKLLAARNDREQAPVGTKHVLSWNALTVAALAHSGEVMGKPEWVERAGQIADALMQYMYRAEGGPWLAIRGQPPGKVQAQSLDYAALAAAFLALHRATGEAGFLERAAEISADMITALWNRERGLFNRRAEAEQLLVETTDLRDSVVPAGNSLAAVVLADLAQQGYGSLAPYAATVLRAHAGIIDQRPSSLPMMLTALAAYHAAELPREAAIPGGEIELAEAALNESRHSEADQPPGLKLKGIGGGTAASGPDATFSGSRVSMTLDRTDKRNVRIYLEVDEGWHINANPASLDFLVPTEVKVFAGHRRLSTSTAYPEAQQVPAEALGEGPIDVYSGTVILRTRMQDTPAPGTALKAVVEVQACNDQGRCLAPDQLEQVIDG